jgi:hypothetical protein
MTGTPPNSRKCPHFADEDIIPFTTKFTLRKVLPTNVLDIQGFLA